MAEFPGVGNRLIAALDAPTRAEADALVAKLGGVPSWIKLGLELFCAEGPSVVAEHVARGHRVMLDLKLHDIPETVARATSRVAQLGAGLLTVHAGGGRAMLEAAVKAAGPAMRVLAVTVLTSLDDNDLLEIGATGPVGELVKKRAQLAIAAGCAGVVASPHEVAIIRAIAPSSLLIVTPGVRPAGAAAGDQKRVMTPKQARTAGADLVVVGRPLRDAADPAAAARAIVDELLMSGGRNPGSGRGPRGTGAGFISGPGERLIYGAGPVRELITVRPQSIKAIWTDPQRAGRQTSDPVAAAVVAARAAGIVVEDRDRQTLDRVAGEGALHQGVVAWLGPFAYAQLEDVVGGDGPALLLALDGVEDPRNLGAILRSAYLLGAGGAIIPDHRAAQVTSVTAKASAGASELLPVVQVPNLVRALEELREHGLWRVAVHASETAQRIDQIDGKLPVCLVLGAEGTGIRPLVAKNCDFHAVIDMASERSGIGSFNVSVAASLALYEMRRQRAAG